MARQRDPKRDEAKQLYLESEGKMLLKDIAERLEKSASQIRKWKNLDKWDEFLKGNVTNESNSNVTNEKERNPTRARYSERKDETFESQPSADIDLTDKQRLFCLYYTKYYNATKAYQKVYECDYTTARTNGSRLLAKANIREAVKRTQEEQAKSIMLDSRAVLQKYIDIAFADMGDYTKFGIEEVITYDEDGFPKVDENDEVVKRAFSYVQLRDSSNVDTSLVTEVKQGKDGISIKLADKMRALDFLSKYTDLLNESELKLLKAERERVKIEKTKIEIEDRTGVEGGLEQATTVNLLFE